MYPASSTKKMPSLYSLEKLIEWKPNLENTKQIDSCSTLYSLEKLIEWKRLGARFITGDCNTSLLAREIN